MSRAAGLVLGLLPVAWLIGVGVGYVLGRADDAIDGAL